RVPEPPRRVLRIVLDVDGRSHFDVSHALALSMIDCHFGRPVVHEMQVNGEGIHVHMIRLTLSEVDS
ncbi:MAG: hypothetical protein ACRETD_03095, partial [Steroidobacteraceae bacterium]